MPNTYVSCIPKPTKLFHRNNPKSKHTRDIIVHTKKKYLINNTIVCDENCPELENVKKRFLYRPFVDRDIHFILLLPPISLLLM